MQSMRERMARRLALETGIPDEWRSYLDDVDAVLEELMEPTQAMVDAGAEMSGSLLTWRAMLAHARKEEG